MKILLFLFVFVASVCAISNEESHEDNGEKEEESITLTEQAVKNFGIKVQKVTPINGKAEIPISAVVKSEDKNQIFVLHAGKYEIREIIILKRTPTAVTVDSLTGSEDVVVSGVNYLKVVEMSHGEESGGGHGH